MHVISYSRLAEHLSHKHSDIEFIAVDAGGGSGKSTFSTRLAEYAQRERPKERADLIVDGAPTLAHDAEVEFVAIGGGALETLVGSSD